MWFRYWLYAAIKCRGLIVTNDEMRDHIFQLLGDDVFPKWKERHQVCTKALHYTESMFCYIVSNPRFMSGI